ncbi:MAG TPA: lipid-A-disaccharide synthase [Gammaproteobacteria bacterium]|nr:lipid-A-disaccharide synthase [Gammaproteobacteria bacterium]
MANRPLRFGVVAGEASGDLLGAGLIQAIKQQHPDAVFEGIAGPQMMAAGAHSLFPMDRLSVMGIVEVLGRYRELLGMRRQLARHFKQNPPDAFIGIDAPDFNLGLERQLREARIKTVHYVSPSVWAWRQRRVKKIAAATDLMLTLFPFEAAFYQQYQVPVRFVGHPLADTIPLEVDKATARQSLGLPLDAEILALLPGSRANELQYLARPFLETACWLQARRPDLRFVVPLANAERRRQFEEALAALEKEGKGLHGLTLVEGHSREVMAAADAVLLASGTAALEAMLLKRPMVVAYKLAPLTYWLATRLLKVENVSLPNLLAGETLVPELIQHAATPENLGREVLVFFENHHSRESLNQRFSAIHRELRRDASQQAAQAILQMLEGQQAKRQAY